MKVNVKDYYPEADYTPYLDGGKAIDKPKDAKLEVGMVMYDKPNNAIGIILGCIDENYHCEVRLDSDGMQGIDGLRLATKEDFEIKDLRFKGSKSTNKLLEEFNSKILTNEKIADNLLSDPQAYNEFIKEMIVARLMDNSHQRTYWDAWFRGAKGKDLENADNGIIYKE